MSIEFNKSQLAAINAPEDKILISAPPGSGKTASIIGAIWNYVEQYPNDRVVAVTFTKKGAEDLASRIGLDSVEVSTIHSWSYRVLQYFAAKYNFTVSLLQEETVKDILKRICVKRKYLYLNQFLLYSYVMGNYNVDVDDTILRKFEVIREIYTEFKRVNKLYDFTDLPLYLSDIMDEYAETIDFVDALFVDEFQDVDDIQISIFDRTHAKKKVYIGDARQSIYIFRGASGAAFYNQEGFKPYWLDTNYRSYQEIIDYADSINDWFNNDADQDTILGLYAGNILLPSAVKCVKGYGGKVYEIRDIEDGIDVFAESLYHDSDLSRINCGGVLKELVPNKRTQILCRSNRQVKKIKSMGIENVSTIHQAKGLEYDNVIVVDFMVNSEEENNVAYVAMTRARNNLVVIDFQTLLYYISSLGLEQSNKLF